MSWRSIEWTADEGVQPFVDALNADLTAHPNWEFVETVVETKKNGPAGPNEDIYFNEHIHTFHIWRCKAENNGIDADFYVAFGKTEQGRLVGEETPQFVSGDSGWMLFTTMKDWDTTTHRGIGHCGRGPTGFQLDSNGTYGNGGQYYPILEPIVEEGGTTWGSWGMFNQEGPIPEPIQTQTRHLMEVSNGGGFGYPSFYSDDPELPTQAQSATIRVTRNSLLILFKGWENNDYPDALYCGIYETDKLPEQMIPDVPILQMQGHSVFSNGSPQNVLCTTDLPGATTDPDQSPSSFFSTPNYSYLGWDSYNPGEGRQKITFPGLGEGLYVAGRWGLSAYAGGGYRSSAYNGIMWPIPGIWCLSTGGLPPGWEEGDTLTSPEGHECVIMTFSSGWDTYFLIDKEAE